MYEKTIAAISTPIGVGGISVIRISGNESISIAEKIFKPVSKKKLSEQKGYTALYGHVFEGNRKIDEVIATVFKAPQSYTGEDVVELSCHGGLYISREILRIVIDNGAYIAEPGEFTKRAFLNGKKSLIEAEAVMDLISATGKSAATAAVASMEGAIYKKIKIINEILTDNIAHLSAWADYPEDEVPMIDEEKLKNDIDYCTRELYGIIENSNSGKVISHGISTVIVGKPNVGKSTLMNLLSGCERSIVTDIPGTTRDIVEDTIMLGDICLHISDTAGIRDTDNEVEKIGVDRAKQKIKSCDLVIAVFDSSSRIDNDDNDIIKQVKDYNKLAVINKSDLKSEIDMNYIKRNFENVVYISAKKGSGLKELSNEIEKIFETKKFDPMQGILSNERQIKAVKNAYNLIMETKDAMNMGFTLDAITVNLEFALQELLELTGERTQEAVVNKIFSNFCVGK